MTALFKQQELTSPVVIDKQTLLSVFELSPTEAEFLHVLLLSDKWVGREDFPEIPYPIRQVIYTLRKKLRGSYGVFIANDGEGRYAMAYQYKKILQHVVAKTTQQNNPEG